MVLDKNTSVYLKGFAVLFMMFLHFGDLHVMPQYRWSWSGNCWNSAFQICVPMFLFLSGYGLTISQMKNEQNIKTQYKKALVRVFKLLQKYWFAIFPFIVIGLFTNVFSFSPYELFINITTLKPTWCGPAWFVFLYIELVFLYPIIFNCIKRFKTSLVLLVFAFVIILTKLLMKIDYIDSEATIFARQIKMLMIDSPIFIEGVLFAYYSIFEKFKCEKIFLNIVLGLALCIIAIFMRAKVPLISIHELLHVPLCLIGTYVVDKNRTAIFFNIYFYWTSFNYFMVYPYLFLLDVSTATRLSYTY